jgi:bacilysin biosynthesis protein BacB
MTTYFPEPRRLTLAPGIETLSFRYDKTEVLISEIAPGAILEPHAHPEAQIGLAISGSFIIEVNGREQVLDPLNTVYVVDPNVPHRAINRSGSVAVGLDLKRIVGETDYAGDDIFLSVCRQIAFKQGLANSFFVGPWFEVMVSKIAPLGVMPSHKHKNEQIGIGVSGSYQMTVGKEESEFKFGTVYFTPPMVRHGAVNPHDEAACSINIFIPPRYNKVRPVAQ